MPQLDVMSFSSQVFWFLIFFYGFYLLMSMYVIPRLAVGFRVRNYYLDMQLKEVETMLDMVFKVGGASQNVVMREVVRQQGTLRGVHEKFSSYSEGSVIEKVMDVPFLSRIVSGLVG